jgi:gliding motility-associated-like protein
MVITINYTPVITTIPDVYACNNYSLPVYNTIATTVGSVSRYYTLSGGPSIAGNIERAVGYNVTTPGLTTLYAYAETGTLPNCYSDKPLAITVLTTPVVSAITAVSACDSYSLPAYSTIASTVPVTRYYTLPGGPTVAGNIERIVGYAVTTPGINTVYAYAEVGTTATRVCFDEKPLVITINRTPVITAIPAVYSCDVYSLPAYASFATTIGSVSHYYTMAGGTSTAGNIEKFVGNNILTPGLTTLYAYAETGTTPNCYSDKPLAITILTTPVVSAITAVSACDTYSLPAFSTLISTVPVNHYYTLPGGTAVVGNIDRPVGYAITTPGLNTVYAYAEVGTPTTRVCFNEQPLAVTINVSPILAPVVSTSHCATENFTLSPLTVGAYYEDVLHTIPLISTTIAATKTIFVYAATGTTPNCTDSDSFTVTIYDTPVFATAEIADVNVCNQYILPALTTPNAKYYTGPNATGTQIPAGTIYTASTQTIYVHAESGISPVICPADSSLLINVFNVSEPLTNPNSNFYCGEYILTPLLIGNYYTGANGSGLAYLAGNVITTTRDIHVFATAPTSFGCSDDYTFNVQVIYAPTAFPIPLSDRTVCDLDGTNDGFTPFNLSALTPTLLGPIQSANPNITVQYFASYANATTTVGGIINAGVNPISSIVADNNLTSIFYSISDNSALNSCKNINPIGVQLIVNKLPEPSETMEPHAICVDPNGVVLRNYTIESNLSPMNHSFVWTDSTGAIVGNGSTLTVSLDDTYSLIATSNSTGCSSESFDTVVINSQKPIVTYTVSDAFDDNQIITVIADGIGDYEYQIDGSPFQDSPIFENQNFVLDHQIVVRDKNGCNDTVIIPVSAVVVNYPKLFTPNGDGWYDTWKIYGIDKLSNAKVSIYNRYGKLITQLNSNSPGWDGTLNNAPMPADDYWFTISYIENGLSKEYKSHFSITR